MKISQSVDRLGPSFLKESAETDVWAKFNVAKWALLKLGTYPY